MISCIENSLFLYRKLPQSREDEEEVLAAISFERAADPDDDQLVPPDDEGNQTIAPPALRAALTPLPQGAPAQRASTLRSVIAAASLGSVPVHAPLARATGTAALVSAMIPPTPVPILWVESLLLWNAAGWWSGDSEGGPDGQQATAASRYDVLDPLLRGPDAPTYIVLNEVSGSSRDSEHPRGLRAWLGKAGYGHQFYPGGSTTSQRSNGSSGATGGLLLAWLKCETTPCGKPEVDPVSMTIMVDFKHRRHAAASPPMRLVAAYGTQQRNGKSKALKTIIRHAMQSRGCLAAGDLNVTPDASWRCSRRRATAADDEFEAITGGGEAGDGTSMVGIVDLGLNHAQGQFSRAHWTDRLADGSPKGTATLDHVLVSGLERGSWTRRAVWHAFGDGGRLVSDHMLIFVERAPRCAPPDDSGVHRLPRYLVSKWKPHQVAAFTASFDLGLTQLRAGQWRPDSEGERQTLGRGADAIVQLVALLNAASAAAVVATRGDPLRDRLRRVRDASRTRQEDATPCRPCRAARRTEAGTWQRGSQRSARHCGAGSVVGVIDAPIDLARLRADGRRLCDPFAWSSRARTLDKLLIGAVQPLDAAMSVVVLRGPPHRGDDGVSAAPRSRIGDALPYRAVGAALELAQLLAVVGDVAEKARHHGGRSRGIRQRRVPEYGSDDDPLQAPIMPSEKGRRVGRVEGLLRGDRALQDALCTKAAVGERIGAERCERGCSLDHAEACPAHSLHNALLSSQLRLDAL